MPGASYGAEDGATGEDTWLLHNGIPRHGVSAAPATVLAGAFWMNRREVRCEQETLVCLNPHKSMGYRSKAIDQCQHSLLLLVIVSFNFYILLWREK